MEQLQREVARLSAALAAAQAAALEAEHARDRLEAEKETRSLQVSSLLWHASFLPEMCML